MRISVLMSAYNSEGFIREAVDSVLNQTYGDFEFLIFEDCSMDRTLGILESYKDARIKLIANETNQGLTKNLIRGMDMARGEYLARMDADDVCHPERFAKQVSFLDSHPDIGLLGTAVDFFDENGPKGIAYQPAIHEEIKCALFLGYTLFHPSVMMRLEAFRLNGLNYDPQFKVSQDHDLWERAARCFCCANLNEPLLRMREHSMKIGNTRKGNQEEFSNVVRKRQLDELGVLYNEEELAAFNWGASPDGHFLEGMLEAYDSLGTKILAANMKRPIFNIDILPRLLASRFHRLCTIHLQNGFYSGRYYWRSTLRRHHKLSSRQWAGLLFRSISC